VAPLSNEVNNPVFAYEIKRSLAHIFKTPAPTFIIFTDLNAVF